MMQPNTVMDQEAANAAQLNTRKELVVFVTLLHPPQRVLTCSKAAVHSVNSAQCCWHTHHTITSKFRVIPNLKCQLKSIYRPAYTSTIGINIDRNTSNHNAPQTSVVFYIMRPYICKIYWSSSWFYHRVHFDNVVIICATLLCVAPGVARGVRVCVCVASISLGRRVAPCCDCVYSFVTLWAAGPSAHNWHCHQMERERERDRGIEKSDRGQEQSWLISYSLALSVFFWGGLIKTGNAI